VRLLNVEKVQTELALTSEQKDKIKSVSAELRPPQGDRSRRDPAQMAELRAKTEAARKQLMDILEPKQRERLKQIRLQIDAVAALLDPETAQALGLTKEQLKEIEAIRRPGGGQGRGGQQAPGERLNQNRREAEEKILKTLTPEQRTSLEKMKGEKFDLDLSTLMPQRGRAAQPAN